MAQAKNLYFLIFIIVATIIIIIFALVLFSPFVSYQKSVSFIENYYKNQVEEATTQKPMVNKFDPSLGYENSTVVVVEYSDFFSPASKELQTVLNSLFEEYGNRVRFVFKGLSLTDNQWGETALMAAYCAQEQNKFADYKNLLFSEPEKITEAVLKSYALQAGLDASVFENCLSNQRYKALIEQNVLESKNLGLTNIPTVYVNNQRLDEKLTEKNLEKLIKQELNK